MKNSFFLNKLRGLSEKYDNLTEQFEKSGDFDIFTELEDEIMETKKEADESDCLNDEDKHEIICCTTSLLVRIKEKSYSTI